MNAPSTHQFGLSAIGQIAVTVRDMDRAIAFYRDALGLRFLFRAPNVAFFDCSGIRLMLGLAEPQSAEPTGTVIYFRVPDIDRAFEILQERGAVFEQKPHLIAKLPDHDLWMAFLRDPDKNLVGIMSEVRHT
jgi:methylmalonyl-CoA/ethylmalonyl-CoA epimerase